MTEAVVAARRPARIGHLEVFAAIGALSFVAARFLPVLALGSQCPLRTLAGIPCATCGMTHAFVYLAHGRVADALAWSPLGAALAAGTWLFALADGVRVLAGWPPPRVAPGVARGVIAAGIAALLLNWAWVLVHGVGQG